MNVTKVNCKQCNFVNEEYSYCRLSAIVIKDGHCIYYEKNSSYNTEQMINKLRADFNTAILELKKSNKLK